MGVQQISPRAVVTRIWEIYRGQLGLLLGIAVALYAVQFVVYLLLSAGGRGTVAQVSPLLVLFFALSIFYQGMVVELVQDVEKRRPDHSVSGLLRSVKPVFWPLLAVSILFGVGVAFGFVFLIAPGLVLIVSWSVVAPVTVLERPGVVAAFGRSQELVRGNGWNVFWVIMIVFVVVAVISSASGTAASELGSLGRALVQWAVNIAVAPVAALGASVLYFTLREAAAESPETPSPGLTPQL